MGGVTNLLLAMGQKALAKEDFIEDLKLIESRHHEVVRSLLKPNDQNPALIATKALINDLEELLFGIKALGELSPSTSDKLVSFGEQLSNQMVATLLSQKVKIAIYGDARHLITTDSSYGRANVIEEESYAKIREWHDSIGDAIGVVTGFIAADEHGKTTTLGRGGSDYTAAIIGAALDAEEIQIWTDVNGFMTADPRMVKNAYSLEHLSYEEAMELSFFGAKVIYPPTMLPAIAKQIPITIKNTFNPSNAGTRIGQGLPSTGIIKGIASVPDICMLNVEGSAIIGTRGFSGKLFTALAQANVNIMLITQSSSEHSISIAIAPEDGAAAMEATSRAFELERLRGKLREPQLVSGLSIMAVVGENMRHSRGLSGKLFSTLGRSGVNVVAIAQGSSELNISVVIDRTDLGRALVSVHDSLFLSPLKTINVFCAGTGKIGSELIDQLAAAKSQLAERHHMQVIVRGIANSRKMLIANLEGIDLSRWREEMETKSDPSDAQAYINAIKELDLPNTALIDNTSSRAFVAHYEELFANDISVVTCNKVGNSESQEQYEAFKNRVLKSPATYHYETTVGAALPIIRTLNDLLVSGDRILKIEAVLSGTISFIFNNFKGDQSFKDIVKEAQEKGFTEPDPRDDLNGMDFSRKMLILARELGLELEMSDVEIDPILPENCLKADSIDAFYTELENASDHFENLKNKAASQQKVLRYIGKLIDGKIKIAIELVASDHAFYSLTGSDNIIAFTTERYHSDPLVIKGPGAGIQVTAGGVFADIIRISQL